MRAFAFAYQSQTESIHDITCMITFFRNPVHYDLFLSFNTKIFNAGNYFRQFGHTLSRIFFPTFLYCLFIIFGRSHKEEAACLPQFLYETYAVFHHPDHSNNLLERSLHTVFFQYRHKQFGNLFIRFLLDIQVVEPNTFLIIKFSTRLTATVQVE